MKTSHKASLNNSSNEQKERNWFGITNERYKLFIVFLLLILSIPSVLPLFHHGFFQTDDGEWMIIRLSAFYQALHDGQFPVRFLQRLNSGYGYPVAEFLYPGSFYLGTILHVIRFGFVNSIKIVFGLSLVGSLFFTYFWLSKSFSRFASVIGSLCALYIPYHLYDVYKRGSIEVFALLWVPFILWQIERKSILWVSIGIALLLISHNTMALLFLPVLFVYGYLRKTFSFRLLITSFIFGILLSSFFIIPAVFELHYTVFSHISVSNPQLYFANVQLIGYAVLFVLVGVVVLFFLRRKPFEKLHSLILYFFVLNLLTIFLTLPLSSFIWLTPIAPLIQFPFRVLSYLMISVAFLATFLISALRGKQQIVLAIILLVVLGYSAVPYARPVSYFDKGEGYYYTNDATTTVADEYMPIWVKKKPENSPLQKAVIIKGTGQVKKIVSTNDSLTASFLLKEPSTVQINIIFWPGWQATLDGKPVAISYNNPMGVLIFHIPAGKHLLHLFFIETFLRLFADMISLLSFIFLCVFVNRQSKL